MKERFQWSETMSATEVMIVGDVPFVIEYHVERNRKAHQQIKNHSGMTFIIPIRDLCIHEVPSVVPCHCLSPFSDIFPN